MTKQKRQDQNPFDSDSPEWQLYENWKSHERLIASEDAAIERSTAHRTKLQQKQAQYAEVLRKLGAEV